MSNQQHDDDDDEQPAPLPAQAPEIADPPKNYFTPK